MTIDWMSSGLDAGHTVDPDQFEPGIADEEQAHAHLVSLDLSEVTARFSLGLTERWALDVAAPFREVRVSADFEDEEGRRMPEFESIHHRDETISGMGDLSVVGRYRWKPLNVVGWVFDLAAGVSLPTGDIEEDPFARGAEGLAHQHIFFGSGTVDPIASLSGYRRSDVAPLVGWLRLSAPFEANSKGYQAGERVSTGVGVSPSFGLERWSFVGQLELFHEEPSEWSGREARNSGRTDIVANIGGFWSPSADWTVQVMARVPDNLDARGGQLDLEPILTFGVTRSWSLKPHVHGDEEDEHDEAH
jgi:hypothetical protein